MRNGNALALAMLTALGGCVVDTEVTEPTHAGVVATSNTAPSERSEASETKQCVASEDARIVVLVLDVSGTMDGKPMEELRRAVREGSKALRGDDWLGVVAFDSQPTVVMSLREVGDGAEAAARAEELKAGGGAEFYPALDAAWTMVKGCGSATVILVTDSKAPRSGLRDLAQTMGDGGVTISSVAIGADTDVPLLKMLAGETGGELHVTNEPEKLPAVVVDMLERP